MEATVTMKAVTMTTTATNAASISTGTMNTYGRQAQEHMRRYLPERFATIPDPSSYFRELGEQVAEQILAVERGLIPPAAPGEPWIDTVGKAKMARMMAAEQVMAEMVWLTPENQPDEPTIGDNGGWIGSDPGMPNLVLAGMTQADLDEMDTLT
ncbi:MAG: hypothetical protein ACYDH6_22560 [Acidimicrobiales bacterium]